MGDFNFDIRVEIPDINDLPWGATTSTAYMLMMGMPIYQGCRQFLASSYEGGLFESIEKAGLVQQVQDATHTDGGILDLIFSSPGFVKKIKNRGNINVNSAKQDHCILIFKLLLGNDCERRSRPI